MHLINNLVWMVIIALASIAGADIWFMAQVWWLKSKWKDLKVRVFTFKRR